MPPTATTPVTEDREERRRRRHEARAGTTYRHFLKLASAELGLAPEQSERVVAAVLGALERRLPFDEMKDLASQLPSKLRELLASCDGAPDPVLPREIGPAEFLAIVARDLDVDPDQAELQVRGVFRLLALTVTPGEIEQVIHLLPRGLRALWPRGGVVTPVAPETAPAEAAVVRHMHELLERQRGSFREQGSPSARLRIERLDRLIASLRRHESQIVEACAADFGQRSPDTSRCMDIAAVIAGAKYAKKMLPRWMKPERRRPELPFAIFGATAEVRFQPLGVVGIVSPWNLPLLLTFAPLVGVLAAGNRALLKPSELTPNSARLIHEIVRTAFDESEVAVVLGGREVGAAFVRLPFDHLIFTGNRETARQIMRAAADQLVPVTLELGGKCPVIIGEGTDLSKAALKIMNGKCLNGGQTCLAPDYVLVPAAQRDELVRAMRAAVTRMFDGLRDNPDYTALIDERHRRRIESFLEDARAKGALILELNPRNESFAARAVHKLPPSLVLNVDDGMLVMKEEIFGPVLPIKTYQTIEEALAYVNARGHPLALYYFGADSAERERVLSQTTSGGVTVNDVLWHAAQEDLPFGGVGPSGMGAYHAREGFLNFSHARAVFLQSRLDPFGALFRPPYGAAFRRAIDSMMRP